MSERLYTITCTFGQLEEIRDALEACFRMGIGQPSKALGYCRAEDGEPAIWMWGDVHPIEKMIKDKMGLSTNASWGVGRFNNIDVLCEMYKTIERFMSWDYAVSTGLVPSMDSPRDWKTMMGCNYDDPMQYTQEPMIVVNEITAQPGQS